MTCWREFELSRVRVTEGKITVNVWRKSRGNRFWFELARVLLIGSQLYKIHLSHHMKEFSSIPHGHSTRKILLKLILPKLKMPAWEKYQLMCLFPCMKRSKETWICNLCKRTFSKGESEVVRRCTWNTITIHCSVLIQKSQSF